MWRSVLVLILLPSLTAAQSAPEVHPEFSPQTVNAILYGPPRNTASSASSYQAYTRFTAIRRGTEEDVGIMLWVGGLVTTSESAVPGIQPLKIEFDHLDGFTIGEIHGPKLWKSNFKFRGETIKVSSSPYIQFKLRADRNATLGDFVLKGKLTFQKVPADGSAAGAVEQVNVLVPLTVVEYGAKVYKGDFPYGPMPGWQTFLLYASIPVLIVLFIPLLLICTVTGTCRSASSQSALVSLRRDLLLLFEHRHLPLVLGRASPASRRADHRQHGQ